MAASPARPDTPPASRSTAATVTAAVLTPGEGRLDRPALSGAPHPAIAGPLGAAAFSGAVTVECSDYREHASDHVRQGDRFLCLRCTAPPATPARRAPRRRWRAWDARLAVDGPWHARTDRPDGSKAVTWLLAPGLGGLGGHHLEDLVYLAQPLTLLALGEPLVVTEGEKSADAVAAAGHWAAGTVCGAAATPGEAVVRLLAAHPIVLWPDADAVGLRHADRLGRALEVAGVPSLAIVRPPADVPAGWDAADTSPERIRELVGEALGRPIGPV